MGPAATPCLLHCLSLRQRRAVMPEEPPLRLGLLGRQASPCNQAEVPHCEPAAYPMSFAIRRNKYPALTPEQIEGLKNGQWVAL